MNILDELDLFMEENTERKSTEDKLIEWIFEAKYSRIRNIVFWLRNQLDWVSFLGDTKFVIVHKKVKLSSDPTYEEKTKDEIIFNLLEYYMLKYYGERFRPTKDGKADKEGLIGANLTVVVTRIIEHPDYVAAMKSKRDKALNDFTDARKKSKK